VESDKPQCAPCRFEHRGGVEDYAAAAARTLGPQGRFVMCAASFEAPRVRDAAKASGLDVLERLDVIPREGKPPLVTIFTARRGRGAWPDVATRVVVRDATGAWTPDFAGVRRAMGMPDRPPRA
jgi:tRNA1(Val) A37 N6-methylase TrmN6